MNVVHKLHLKRDLCDAVAEALQAETELVNDHARLQTAAIDRYCERHGGLSPAMVEIILAILRLILSNL